MTTTAFGPTVSLNRKQLRQICRNYGVSYDISMIRTVLAAAIDAA